MRQGRRRGLLDRWPVYHECSSRLQSICRKYNLEKVRKCDGLIGYELLGMTDMHFMLPEYGVGILDEFLALKPGDQIWLDRPGIPPQQVHQAMGVGRDEIDRSIKEVALEIAIDLARDREPPAVRGAAIVGQRSGQETDRHVLPLAASPEQVGPQRRSPGSLEFHKIVRRDAQCLHYIAHLLG